MKKEEIITASIMILIIVLEIFIQCYTKKSIEKLTSDLKELKEMTLEAQKDQEDSEEKRSNQNKEENVKESTNEKNGENMKENDEPNSEGNKENDTKNSDLSKKSQEIFKEWLKNFNVMAYFIEHDELEKVNTQMRLIMAEYEAKSLEDAVPEIEDGIFILEHIEDRQKITWKNIF